MRCNIVTPLRSFPALIMIVTLQIAYATDAFCQFNDPRDLSGNVLWLDGADVDGDFVDGGAFANNVTWVDKSTAQNADATQMNMAGRPTVVSSPFNNLTAVEFDGDDFMDVSNAAFGMLRNVAGATMIGVLATDQESSNRALRALMVSSGSNSAGTRAGINLYDSFQTSNAGSGDFGLAGRRLDVDGFQRIEGGNVVVGELAVMTGLFDYQAGDLTLFVNGQQESSFTSFQTPGLTSDTDSLNIRVGADAAINQPRGFFDGQVLELIVYNRVLSTSELDLINTYISEKWIGGSVLLGDFDTDGDVDGDDVDFYIGNIGADATGALAQLDLDEDETVTLDDHNTHVMTLVQTSNGVTGSFLGDVNLDGTVDVLIDAFALVAGLGQPATSRAQGDLNADGTVDVLGDAFILVADLGQAN